MSKSLKPAMYYSILLLALVIFCSIQLNDREHLLSSRLYFYGGRITPFPDSPPFAQTETNPVPKTEGQHTKTDAAENSSLPGEDLQGIPSLPASVWDLVPGVKDSPVYGELSENVIAIAKPGFLTGKETVELVDFTVDRQLQFTIKGMEVEGPAFTNIYRIIQDMLFDQPSAEPTPSPSPTPKPSEEKEEEYPTDYVPEYIPEDMPPLPVEDPVRSSIASYTEEEDGTFTASILFHLSRTYDYKLLEDAGYYYICLCRPKDVYEKIVVIDAGHGLNDPGTYSKGYEFLEKDMNLSILLYLKEFLDADEEITAYYTRTTDRRLTFNQRVNLANDLEADFFISIHCNSGPSAASGTEVLYSDRQDLWTGMNSKRFSRICLEEILPGTGLPNRGIYPRSYDVHVINAALVPMALIETAFMTNTRDLEVLVKEETHKAVAEGLYRAIKRAYVEMEEMEQQEGQDGT